MKSTSRESPCIPNRASSSSAPMHRDRSFLFLVSLLLAAVSACLLPATHAQASESSVDWWYVKQLTNDSHGLNSDLGTDGYLLVYRVAGKAGLWVHDFRTRGTLPIPDMAGSKGFEIAGDRVLWLDGPLDALKLYSFDIHTKQTTLLQGICPPTTQIMEAQDNLLVFNLGTPYGGRTDVIVYDFKTGESMVVAHDGAFNRFLGWGYQNDGRYLVWSRIDQGEMKIYLYDSVGKVTTLIMEGLKAEGLNTCADESIADGLIAFTAIHEGDYAVFVGDPQTLAGRVIARQDKPLGHPLANKDLAVWSYGVLGDNEWNQLFVADLETGILTRLTDSQVPREKWCLSGELVSWTDGDQAYQDVWVYDHSSGAKTRLTHDEGRKQELVASGNHVAWLQDPINNTVEDRQLFLASGVPLFTDIQPADPHGEAVYGLEGERVVSGYATASGWEFRPDQPVLRAQFAKMICGTLGLWIGEDDWLDTSAPFWDVGADSAATLYPHEYIAVAAREKITKGTRAHSFSPWVPIIRAQVVTMAVRAAQGTAPRLLANAPSGYAGSLGNFDPTHAANMRMAEYNGLLEDVAGYGPGWDPWAEASRAETAQILWNVLVRLAPGGGGDLIFPSR